MSKQHFEETEVKLYIPDLQGVAARLEQAGAKLIRPRVLEHNVRYENAERSLVRSGIVVRLRKDASAWLTFKAPASCGQATSARVSRPKSRSATSTRWRPSWAQLGYYPYMVYEKYRTTYLLRRPTPARRGRAGRDALRQLRRDRGRTPDDRTDHRQLRVAGCAALCGLLLRCSITCGRTSSSTLPT
jgi:hypothetical protein